MMDEE
jgi:hypothetical protein